MMYFGTVPFLVFLVQFISNVTLSIIDLVSVAMIKHHDQRQLGDERVYFTYTSIKFITEGNQGKHSKQGRNYKARVDAEAREECCLLVHSLWFARLAVFFFDLLSYIHQNHQCQQSGTTHNGLGFPYHSLIKKMTHRFTYR